MSETVTPEVAPVVPSAEETTLALAKELLAAPPPAEVVEETIVPKVEDKKEEPLYSKAHLALAKKEAKFQREREALVSEREALKTEREQMKRWTEAVANAKKDPYAALEAMGISVNDLINNVGKVDLPSDPRIAALQEELKELKKEKTESSQKQSREESQKQVDSWFASNKNEITKAGSKYELVNAGDYHDDVSQYMINYFNKYNEDIDWQDAADAVEKHIEQLDIEKLPYRVARILEKRKTDTTEPSSEKTLTTPKNKSGTLSNTHTTAPVGKATAKTAEDRLRETEALARSMFSP